MKTNARTLIAWMAGALLLAPGLAFAGEDSQGDPPEPPEWMRALLSGEARAAGQVPAAEPAAKVKPPRAPKKPRARRSAARRPRDGAARPAVPAAPPAQAPAASEPPAHARCTVGGRVGACDGVRLSGTFAVLAALSPDVEVRKLVPISCKRVQQMAKGLRETMVVEQDLELAHFERFCAAVMSTDEQLGLVEAAHVIEPPGFGRVTLGHALSAYRTPIKSAEPESIRKATAPTRGHIH
jgi:hypothetical protein